MESFVHFVGEVPTVHEYLQASDAFVLPSEDEAFGLALIEAMACGLPVVSTRVGGIPEIVAHGETGLLVQLGNSQELCDALERLITDATLADSVGRAARAAVAARYSRASVASQYMELFGALDRRAAVSA